MKYKMSPNIISKCLPIKVISKSYQNLVERKMWRWYNEWFQVRCKGLLLVLNTKMEISWYQVNYLWISVSSENYWFCQMSSAWINLYSRCQSTNYLVTNISPSGFILFFFPVRCCVTAFSHLRTHIICKRNKLIILRSSFFM